MLLRTLSLGLGLAAASVALMGPIQLAHAQAVVECGPYGCVPEVGYITPGYVAEPGYVVEPSVVEPGYVAEPGYVEGMPSYVPVDPGYAVALAPTVGPDCYWRRGPLGRLRSWCD